MNDKKEREEEEDGFLLLQRTILKCEKKWMEEVVNPRIRAADRAGSVLILTCIMGVILIMIRVFV